VIDETDDLAPTQVRRLVFCSGKVYFDLLKARRKDAIRDVALVRVEQLYPFPSEEYEAILGRYSGAREIVWCQEEPQNQGAWYQIRHRCRSRWVHAVRFCMPAAPCGGACHGHCQDPRCRTTCPDQCGVEVNHD